MNKTVEILGSRLKSLMGNLNFRSDFDKALDSPEHLMAIGEHNLREYEKIETMGEEHQARIQNLISNILASALQEKAIMKYGNTDSGSIRRVLYDCYDQPDNRAYCDRLTQSAKQAMMGCNLTERQLQGVGEYFDLLLRAMIEIIVEQTSHLRLLPRAQAQSISMALVDMIKEAKLCYR